MKKKLLLALTLVAVFVCLFAIAVSAANQSYTTFDVTLTDGTTKTVYTPGTDEWQGRVYLTTNLYTEAPLDSAGTYGTIAWADVKVIDFSNSMIYFYSVSNGTWTEMAYGRNNGNTMMYIMKNGATSAMMTSLEKVITGKATHICGGTFNGIATLKEVVISKDMQNIEYNSFDRNPLLTKVTFEEGSKLKSIGQQTFLLCTALETITIPDTVNSMGNDVFNGCTSLKTVDWSNSMTTIPSNTFYNCTSLTSIDLPDTLTQIGDNALAGCSSLTLDVDVSSLTVIGAYAFKDATYLVGELDLTNATKIGDQAFANCTNITKVTVSNSLTKMGESVYSGCTSLASINWSENITTVPNTTFDGCTSLAFEIPSYITYIGSCAFRNCDTFTTVNIPAGVTGIGGYAFAQCDNLTAFNFAENNSMGGSLIGIVMTCPKLTSFKIPAGVTTLGYDNFWNCESLSEIDISGITTITGGNNFANTNITKLVFSNELETLPGSNINSKIEEIRFGANIKSIGSSNLLSKTLKKVYLPATVVELGSNILGYSNPADSTSNITFIFTGTKAQAEALQAYYKAWTLANHADHAPNSSKLYDAPLVSALEFDVTAEPVGCTFVYGYNLCDAFYAAKHNEGAVEAKFEGAAYVTDYVHASTCLRCQKSFVVDTICGPLFIDLGYAKAEDGSAFTYDLKLNKANIETYEELTGKALNYGFIVGSYNGETGDIIDMDGNAAIQKAIVTDFADVQFSALNKYCLKMTGISADQYEMLIFCNAYVLDGTAISYMGAVKEDGKALAVSYKTLPVKE